MTKSVASVDEGGTVLFTLATTGVAAGSDYTYTLSGVSASDVVGGSLTGTARIASDGKAVVQVNLVEDARTEGAETLTLNVANQSASVTVNDTSAAAAEQTSFTVTPAAIASANVGNGTAIALDVGNTGSRTVTIQSDGAAPTAGVIINGDANTTVTSGASGDRITLSGNGNNSINTGAGNDTVTVFGSGNNSVNVGTGNDSVTTGAGNDTITFGAGALGAGDTVNAGAGTDTVVISGEDNVIGTGGATLVGVENLVLNGTGVSIDATTLATLIENGLKTISGSALTSEVTITGLNNAPGALLNLSTLTITGGLEAITTTGTGTIILNTQQTSQIVTVASGQGTLTQQVIVTGAQTVAQADALIASGVTAKFAVVDTAENIALASASVFAKAVSIEATTDATAAQALKIASGIAGSSNTSIYASAAAVDAAVKVSVTDTASMLANNASALAIADNVTATTAATLDEAKAINDANTGGGTLFTASYAVADTGLNLFLIGASVSSAAAANAATSVTITDPVSVGTVGAINQVLANTTGGLTKVASGYNLVDAVGTLIDTNNAAITAAARNVTVASSAAISAANAVAVEGLSNTGDNTYKLQDSTLLLRNVGPDVTAVATKAVTGGVVATGSTVTVAELNALVAKFGNTAFSTSLVVTDSAAELVKLSSAALKELGSARVVVDSNTTATVAELTALNAFFTGTIANNGPVANTVKVKDTVAELTAAVKVSTTLAALDASASVAVSDASTVAQISAINTALAGSVAIGYALADTAAKLSAINDAGVTRNIVDSSAKVTVFGPATVDQIDEITDAFSASGSFTVADIGTKIVYALKDSGTNLTTAINSDGNGGVLANYLTGASSITLSNPVVTAAQAIALRVSANYPKFDGVYAIEGDVTALNTAYGTNQSPNLDGRSALAGATSVTLVDSFTNLFTAGVPAPIQAIAGTVIAKDTLINLTAANAADKANVDGFRIDGSVTLADLVAVNALSAIAPAQYNVAQSNYAALTSTAAGVATFVNKAASLDVSDAVTVAKADTLLGKITGTIVYDVVDTAANIAGAAAAVIGNDRNLVAAIDTTGTAAQIAAKRLVNVAQATILQAAGVSGYTISDTAANISAAKLAVLTGALGNPGEGVVVNDGVYTTLTVAAAEKVYGAGGNATGRYNLVDTAANLFNATPTLRGYALNVTATTAATAAQGQEIGRYEALGTVTYDVTDTVAALLNGRNAAGLNGARNVAVTTGTAAATLVAAINLQEATNSGTLSYNISDAGSTIALDLLSTDPLVLATAIAALNGATTVTATGTVNGADATALAAQDKAIVYNISADEAGLSASTVSAGALTEAKNITVTGTVKAAFAAKVLAANPGVTLFPGTVSGTSAELAALQLGTGDSITTLTATTASTVAEAKAIVALGAATTYGLKDTAANLAAATFTLLDNATLVTSGFEIEATTAATAAEAIKLEASTSPAKYAIADTYANLMANTNVIGDVDADAAITTATKVTVADGPLTLAQAAALSAVDASVLAKAVFSILDSDAAIATAISAAPSDAAKIALQNAVSVVGEARVAFNIDVIGSTTYLVGTKAQLAALSPELKASSVPKLVEASLADLTSDAAYYSALPAGTSLRVIDTFANLTSGNSVAATATSIIVTDAMTTAQATTIRAFGAAEKVYNLSDTAALLSADANVMTSATNIVASGTATQAQVVSILGAGNAGTTTIAAATMTATQADAFTYNTGEKITSLTVTGTASVTDATGILADIKAGKVGSATYSLLDGGSTIGADSTTAAAARNGATNITTNSVATPAEAQLILSASNPGTTSISSVAGSPKDVAALVVGSNDTISTITVTGTTSTTWATVAQAVAIAALDARTGTSVVYNFDISDTAAAILAAPLDVLDAIGGTVKVKGAVDVATAAQVLALDTVDTSITVSTLAVTDTVAALKAASMAVGAGATKVTVSGEAKVADITAIDTLFTVNAGTSSLVYDLNDTYAALGSNASVAAGSTKVTVSGTITVGQAAIVYAWGGATYNIKASPTSIANASTSTHVLGAASVLVDGAATVAEAGKLSELTNLTAAGFAILDTAAEVYAAYNAVNANGTKDLETLALAKSINLNNGATVEQLVGTATADGISGIVASYTINDSAASIGAALASPAKAALIEFATKVSSSTDAASVANILAIQDIFGARFVGYDDPSTTQVVEKSYFLSDSALNLNIADEALINGAASVTVAGTDSADTINVSGLTRSVTINAGIGNDAVTGTAFADTITLGAGSDFLVLNQTGTADTITDYNLTDDTIMLSKSVFTSLSAAVADTTLGSEFASFATATALAGGLAGSTNAEDFIYLSGTGELYYNADGATAGGLVLVATFQGAPVLTATEFAIIG